MRKNLFFTALLLAVVTLGLNAQKIKLTDGDPSVLKGEEKLKLVYTYDNLNVGKMTEADYIAKKREEANNREPGTADKWEASWKGDREENYEPKFEELLNKYLEGENLKADKEFEDAKYTMVVHTDFIEPGFNVGVARRPAYIDATVNIIETATGESVATITVLKSPGADAMGFDFDSGYRIGEAYAKAGKEIGKLLQKKYL